MASFYATLQVAGEKYTLLRCRCHFFQPTDSLGSVYADVENSTFSMEIAGEQYDTLAGWAFNSHQKLNGEVTFYRTDQATALTTISFNDGRCISYEEVFLPGEGTTGSYSIHLGISCAKITIGGVEHDNQWVIP